VPTCWLNPSDGVGRAAARYHDDARCLFDVLAVLRSSVQLVEFFDKGTVRSS
jgi:hypothetical protein